jgi:hypothetical protein
MCSSQFVDDGGELTKELFEKEFKFEPSSNIEELKEK